MDMSSIAAALIFSVSSYLPDLLFNPLSARDYVLQSTHLYPRPPLHPRIQRAHGPNNALHGLTINNLWYHHIELEQLLWFLQISLQCIRCILKYITSFN